MLVVDSSAIVAIMQDEPEADALIDRIGAEALGAARAVLAHEMRRGAGLRRDRGRCPLWSIKRDQGPEGHPQRHPSRQGAGGGRGPQTRPGTLPAPSWSG